MSLEVAEGDPGTLHIDPYEAAKEIRTLARDARLLLGNGSPNLTDANYYLDHVIKVLDVFMPAIFTQLDTAIAARRPEKRADAITALRSNVSSAKKYAEAAKSQVGKPFKVNKQVDDVVKRIHVLSQSLPTTEYSVGTPADQTLRAMAMILVNSGYAKPIPRPTKGG